MFNAAVNGALSHPDWAHWRDSVLPRYRYPQEAADQIIAQQQAWRAELDIKRAEAAAARAAAEVAKAEAAAAEGAAAAEAAPAGGPAAAATGEGGAAER